MASNSDAIFLMSIRAIKVVNVNEFFYHMIMN